MLYVTEFNALFVSCEVSANVIVKCNMKQFVIDNYCS